MSSITSQSLPSFTAQPLDSHSSRHLRRMVSWHLPRSSATVELLSIPYAQCPIGRRIRWAGKDWLPPGMSGGRAALVLALFSTRSSSRFTPEPLTPCEVLLRPPAVRDSASRRPLFIELSPKRDTRSLLDSAESSSRDSSSPNLECLRNRPGLALALEDRSTGGGMIQDQSPSGLWLASSRRAV